MTLHFLQQFPFPGYCMDYSWAIKRIFLSTSNLLFQVIFHSSFVMQIFRTLSKVKYCIISCLPTYLVCAIESF